MRAPARRIAGIVGDAVRAMDDDLVRRRLARLDEAGDRRQIAARHRRQRGQDDARRRRRWRRTRPRCASARPGACRRPAAARACRRSCPPPPAWPPATAGVISDPPSRVSVASALITRRMPSRSYTPIAAVLSSLDSPSRSTFSIRDRSEPADVQKPSTNGPADGPKRICATQVISSRSFSYRRSVPLPSRSPIRSAHRTTHPATPRPRRGVCMCRSRFRARLPGHQ